MFSQERHFGGLGWLCVLWQEHRERVGCRQLPCEHAVCRMFREAELANSDREQFLGRHLRD
jgi:hypothetical protein